MARVQQIQFLKPMGARLLRGGTHKGASNLAILVFNIGLEKI